MRARDRTRARGRASSAWEVGAERGDGGARTGPGEPNIARVWGRAGGLGQNARKSRGNGAGDRADGRLCTACARLSTAAVHGPRGPGREPPRTVGYPVGPARTRRADLPLPYEAHLPAQEAQARPHPRFPCPHEHARRPHRAEAPPRQGPQAAHGLVSDRPVGGRTPKRRRLSRSAEFERVYRQGRSKANRFLVLYAFPREDDAPAPASRRVERPRRRADGRGWASRCHGGSAAPSIAPV